MSVSPRAQVEYKLKQLEAAHAWGLLFVAMREFMLTNNGKRVMWTRDIGEKRLAELRLREDKVTRICIDARELGEYSIQRVPVLVALTGSIGRREWRLVAYTHENIDKYFGHCYVVTGKKIRHIGGRQRSGTLEEMMHQYEAEEFGRLEDGHTNARNCYGGSDIFRAGMGYKTRQKVTSKVREGGTIGFVTVTKRFPNSRLTCVCKTRKIS